LKEIQTFASPCPGRAAGSDASASVSLDLELAATASQYLRYERHNQQMSRYGSGGFPRSCPLQGFPVSTQHAPIMIVTSQPPQAQAPCPGCGPRIVFAPSVRVRLGSPADDPGASNYEGFLVVVVSTPTNTKENSHLCPRTMIPPSVSPPSQLEQFPLFIPRPTARRGHRGIRPMVYILKGKVS
jgi:hypothetical protein